MKNTINKGEKIRHLLLTLECENEASIFARFELHWRISEVGVNPIAVPLYLGPPRKHWRIQGFVHAYTDGADNPVINPFYTSEDMDVLEYFMDHETAPTIDQFLEYLQREIKLAATVFANHDAVWIDHNLTPDPDIPVSQVLEYALSCGFSRLNKAEGLADDFPAWQWRMYKTNLFFHHLYACRPYCISRDQAVELMNM